jgi:DNA end-binding protein Ku
MRSIWKGAISFGLVTIPVKLYSATEERDVSFHQVRRSDGSRIKYKRVAAADGEEVSYGDIAKGYELPTGETVVLTDEDFADLPLTTNRAIDVLQFVPLDQVDPIYFAKSYYLEPDKAGVKPYVLLRDALEESGKVALVKVALRQRERLATLRVRDGVFVLETMNWPDEVREPDFGFLGDEVEVRPQELAMATSLIDSLSGDFEPEQYHDDYRQALESLIEAKVAGRDVVAPTDEPATGGAVVDLMAALRASVEAARKNRAAAAGDGEAGTSAGEASAQGTSAEEPPSRRGLGAGTRRAKSGSASAARAAGGGSGAAAGAPADDAPADGAATEGTPADGAEPKAKPKRAPRKKAPAAAGAGSTGDAEPAEVKPARRRTARKSA